MRRHCLCCFMSRAFPEDFTYVTPGGLQSVKWYRRGKPKKKCRECGLSGKNHERGLDQRLAWYRSEYGLSAQALCDMWEAQGRACAYCRIQIDASKQRNYHIDHRVTRAHGGSNETSNLQLLCVQCNHAKGSRSEDYFIRWATRVAATGFSGLVRCD